MVSDEKQMIVSVPVPVPAWMLLLPANSTTMPGS
jgi:hypothetical protein